MKPLEPPDSHHLKAAEGWLELGNPLEANAELEQIAPQLRARPDVLEVRWHLCAHAKQWDACVAIAAEIKTLEPERPEGWIHHSFALHELKRTQAAFDQLLPVAERFPEVWTIPYNLGCYCAQLGRLAECGTWLKRAMAIDKHSVQRAAMDDPDLKPFRDSLGDTLPQVAD